jgi:hypothetical protein
MMCWAIYILIVHWFDIYWLVMPNMNEGASNPFGMIEVFTAIGAAGFFAWAYTRQATKHSILAHRDPYLEKCIEHVNY